MDTITGDEYDYGDEYGDELHKVAGSGELAGATFSVRSVSC
jgi:hypothetical protein